MMPPDDKLALRIWLWNETRIAFLNFVRQDESVSEAVKFRVKEMKRIAKGK